MRNIIEISIKDQPLNCLIENHSSNNPANLSDADLHDINLREINLCYAIIKNANLSGTVLIGTNLYGANLEGANLEGAYLEGAILKNANLKGANLEGAYLESYVFYIKELQLYILDSILLHKIKPTLENLGCTDFNGATMPDGKIFNRSFHTIEYLTGLKHCNLSS